MTAVTEEPLATAVRSADLELGEQAVRHLQALLRIDTTNPPGNETPAAEYLADLLAAAGLEPALLGPVAARRSVVARLRGRGDKPPLLLSAHLDVVPADSTAWRYPPFEGGIHDGYLWGRGAIDMKHMAVMSTVVLGRLAAEKRSLGRDVIFAGIADEEAGCDQGSRWLVDYHPDRVRAEYALGEAGGFTHHFGGRALYPVQVADVCIYCVNWGFRLPGGMNAPTRPEIADEFGPWLTRMQYSGQGYKDGEVFNTFGIVFVPDPYQPRGQEKRR